MTSILKVDEIQNTGGTSALTIDSDGVISTPSTSKPAFMARRTSLGSAGIVIFDNAVLNQGSCYNTTDGKFTAPKDGLYSFSSVVLSDMNGTDNYFQLSLLINGTSYAKVQDYSFNDNDSSGSLSVIASLTATDYVQVNFDQPFYGASSAASNFTYFSGFLIG